MSKSHQLAWAAGFIDGDGFITIQDRTTKIKNKTYNGYYIRLGCCQASETPLKELQKLFGGVIRIKNCGPNKENYNRKIQYIWALSTQQATEVIKQLFPYLVHKKEVAKLAIEFQTTMGNYYKVPDEILLRRVLLKDKIQTLNALN